MPGPQSQATAAAAADIKLSYLLLSPRHAFSSIATSARAVVLAGGTMSPFEDYTAHLFPSLDPAKITTLSCDHVIPRENLCVWTLTNPRGGGGSSGAGAAGAADFEFSFQKRGDRAMIRDLGIAILNICTVVPDGVVVFFPSYGYLDEVVGVWGGGGSADDKKTPPTVGATPSPITIWQKLRARKAVFRETKGGSSDDVLEQYSRAILGDGGGGGGGGALLLSVVGGKMSEGINFSDRLGRCVVVVGLPYPNAHAADWKARIEHVEATTLSRLQEQQQAPSPPAPAYSAAAKQAARDFYENACMRAVNQSVGRAVRHRADYAAIVLVDRRFASPRIRAKLPAWIRAGLAPGCETAALGLMMGRLAAFFRARRDAA